MGLFDILSSIVSAAGDQISQNYSDMQDAEERMSEYSDERLLRESKSGSFGKRAAAMKELRRRHEE